MFGNPPKNKLDQLADKIARELINKTFSLSSPTSFDKKQLKRVPNLSTIKTVLEFGTLIFLGIAAVKRQQDASERILVAQSAFSAYRKEGIIKLGDWP